MAARRRLPSSSAGRCQCTLEQAGATLGPLLTRFISSRLQRSMHFPTPYRSASRKVCTSSCMEMGPAAKPSGRLQGRPGGRSSACLQGAAHAIHCFLLPPAAMLLAGAKGIYAQPDRCSFELSLSTCSRD